jgi:SAM-dependent methyltransferase
VTTARDPYGTLGAGYATHRRPDLRIARFIWAALGDARTVLNVGAGTGSYEPAVRRIVAVEPSAVMIGQRSRGAAPVVQGRAESLPFADRSFDVALAILTVHHWASAPAGLAELRRVSRRQVVLTWDPEVTADFWLVKDYLPEIAARERGLACLGVVTRELARGGVLACGGVLARGGVLVGRGGEPVGRGVPGLHSGELVVREVPVPGDCSDGFLGAHWRRPEAYLNPAVRAAMSGIALLDQDVVSAAAGRLAADLTSGRWHEHHGHLLQRSELDLGYRLVVAGS